MVKQVAYSDKVIAETLRTIALYMKKSRFEHDYTVNHEENVFVVSLRRMETEEFGHTFADWAAYYASFLQVTATTFKEEFKFNVTRCNVSLQPRKDFSRSEGFYDLCEVMIDFYIQPTKVQ